MDNEKDVFKAIAALGRAIADFELTVYCKNSEIAELKKRISELEGEKNALR